MKELKRLNEASLDAIVKRGFKATTLNKLTCVCYMLSTTLKTYNLQMQDYLKEYKLENLFGNDISSINRSHEFFEKRVRAMIIGENIKEFFSDWDNFYTMVDDWATVGEDDKDFKSFSISSYMGKDKVHVRSQSKDELAELIADKMESSEEVSGLLKKAVRIYEKRKKEVITIKSKKNER